MTRSGEPLYIIQNGLLKAVERQATKLQGQLLDIGCGQQPYRTLFKQVSSYVGLDLPSGHQPGVQVQVYGSALALPFATASFDSVLCSEVLEHLPEPGQAVAEAARVLKPGGYLLLTVPWLWPVHAAPHDYYRYTPYGLRYLLERNQFEVLQIEKTSGLIASIGQRLSTGLAYGLGLERRSGLRQLSRVAGAGLQQAALWLDAKLNKAGEPLNYVVLARRLSY